jgi:hypothetical protein
MKGDVKKKTLAARLGEDFVLDIPLHRTIPIIISQQNSDHNSS